MPTLAEQVSRLLSPTAGHLKKIIAALLVALGSTLPAEAQVSAPVGISPGARLRITVDNGVPIVGSLVRMGAGTLDIIDSRATGRQVTTTSLTSLERSNGRPVRTNRVAKGALKGFLLLGGGATLLILASDPGWAFVGPVLFGPPGALLGGIQAVRNRPEEWERVPLSVLASGGEQGSLVFPVASTAARKGKGRRMAIGAGAGALAGAAFAAWHTSSTPAATEAVMIVIPSALVGGGIAALLP